MNHNLFFVPIICAAIERSDREAALREAFAEIQRLGRQPQFQEGFRQFQQFMAICARPAGADVDALASVMLRELITEVIAELESDADVRAALNQLPVSRAARTHVETCLREAADLLRPNRRPGIVIHRDEHRVAALALDPPHNVMSDVAPGAYSVRLDTGRVLWEESLSETDLYWHLAFPGRPLDLAAATETRAEIPSQQIPLLGGELTLRVYPGIEHGRLKVEHVPPEGGRR